MLNIINNLLVTLLMTIYTLMTSSRLIIMVLYMSITFPRQINWVLFIMLGGKVAHFELDTIVHKCNSSIRRVRQEDESSGSSSVLVEWEAGYPEGMGLSPSLYNCIYSMRKDFLHHSLCSHGRYCLGLVNKDVWAKRGPCDRSQGSNVSLELMSHKDSKTLISFTNEVIHVTVCQTVFFPINFPNANVQVLLESSFAWPKSIPCPLGQQWAS